MQNPILYHEMEKNRKIDCHKNTKQLLDEHEVFGIMSDEHENSSYEEELFEYSLMCCDIDTTRIIICNNILNILNDFLIKLEINEDYKELGYPEIPVSERCEPPSQRERVSTSNLFESEPDSNKLSFICANICVIFEEYMLPEIYDIKYVQSVYYMGCVVDDGRHYPGDGEYYCIECINMDNDDIRLAFKIDFCNAYRKYIVRKMRKIYIWNKEEISSDLFLWNISYLAEKDEVVSCKILSVDEPDWFDIMRLRSSVTGGEEINVINFEGIMYITSETNYYKNILYLEDGVHYSVQQIICQYTSPEFINFQIFVTLYFGVIQFISMLWIFTTAITIIVMIYQNR